MKLITPLDPIELIPYELAAALEADPYFCDIPIVVADEGNIERTIDQLSAILTEKNGKRGIAVIVLEIIGDDEYPNIPEAPLTLYPAFEVIEQRVMNMDVENGGTGKPASKVARQILKVIKPLACPGIFEALQPDKPTIVPIPRDKDHPNVKRRHVNFKCYERDVDTSYAQIAAPDFAQNISGSFTFTCANPTAQIFYTIDGSFPSPTRVAPYGDKDAGEPEYPRGQTFLYMPGAQIPITPQGFVVRARSYPPKGAQQSGEILIPSIVVRAFVEPM